jgi:hypothetical protein
MIDGPNECVFLAAMATAIATSWWNVLKPKQKPAKSRPPRDVRLVVLKLEAINLWVIRSPDMPNLRTTCRGRADLVRALEQAGCRVDPDAAKLLEAPR